MREKETESTSVQTVCSNIVCVDALEHNIFVLLDMLK